MKIFTHAVADKDGEMLVIFYKSGDFSEPLFILSKDEAESLHYKIMDSLSEVRNGLEL